MANPILSNGLASPVSIYETVSISHSDQTRATPGNTGGQLPHPVGTRGFLPDGRVFYWASSGTTACTISQLAVKQAQQADEDNILIDASDNYPAIGDKWIDFSSSDIGTDIVANEFVDGWVMVVDATGQGQCRKITGHGAVNASATDAQTRFEIMDGWTIALDNTSVVNLVHNLYDRIEVGGSAGGIAVGVPMVTIAASGALETDVETAATTITTNYGWVQTWGECAVLVNGAQAAEGNPFQIGADGDLDEWVAAAGSIPALNNVMVGYGISITDGDNDYHPVNLTIRP